jgi:hypothetical protein
MSKNKIVLCEIHHYTIHGRPEKINKEVVGHWIVIDHFDNVFPRDITGPLGGYDSDGSYWSEDWFEDDIPLNDALDMHQAKYISYINSHRFERKKHPTIRNYLQIVSNPNYIQPQIAEIVQLNNGNDDIFYYSVAIIKTHWLRLVQRNWKRVFKERKRIISLRSNPRALYYREVHGKWPNNCIHYPYLNGMLSNLYRSTSVLFA